MEGAVADALSSFGRLPPDLGDESLLCRPRRASVGGVADMVA
jgi:hypothetical protein